VILAGRAGVRRRRRIGGLRTVLRRPSMNTAVLDAYGAFWSGGPMQRRHKTLIAVGLVVFLLGWLAWSVLLTESEVEEPPAAVQTQP
jgi:hypothetical protein